MALFLIALVVRLIVMGCAIDQVGVAGLVEYSADVKNYLAAGEAIASEFNFVTTGVNTFGPGYPILLGFFIFLFGANLVVLTLAQVLIGSVTVVMLAKLGAKLTWDYRIGVLAGLLLALSPTAIGLSVALLSETLFLFLLTVGVWWFVKGLENESKLMLIASGLTLGLATLTRAMGQGVWLIVLVAALVHYRYGLAFSWGKSLARMKYVFMSAGIVLLCVIGWSARNYVTLGHTHLTTSQPTAEAKLAILSRARRTKLPAYDEWKAYQGRLADSLNRSPDYYGTIARVARGEMMYELRRSQVNFTRAFLNNVDDQVHNAGLILTYLTPDWKEWINHKMGWIKRRRYFQILTVLALVGGMLLFGRGFKYQGVMLISLMLYFGLLSGTTLWQTRRIYFPAQVATTIMISTTLMYGFDAIHRRWQNRKKGL